VGFLLWLEGTSFAEWIRISTVGYPMMIAAHAVGMAVMVGLSLMLDMRLLGAFAGIPYSSIYRLLVIAWIGFVVNFLSGTALFSANAATFATQGMFLTKIVLIIVGAASAAYLQSRLKTESDDWQRSSTVPGAVKVVAMAAIVIWLAAIVTGRLTAYV